jgi:vacuolar-type H+-ATPase subunit I/STV1
MNATIPWYDQLTDPQLYLLIIVGSLILALLDYKIIIPHLRPKPGYIDVIGWYVYLGTWMILGVFLLCGITGVWLLLESFIK